MSRTSGLRVDQRVAPRVACGVLLGAALFSVATVASADVQACLTASEKGQRARGAGKLREARESFIVCGAESCPLLVRRDCVQWNSDLATTLPTVVFGAKDKQGRDLFNVTVSMDGEVLLRRLDGKSVTVDPGKHNFRFEAAGLPPVSEAALVKEGEHARAIDVTFENASTPVVTTTPAHSSGDNEGGTAKKNDGDGAKGDSAKGEGGKHEGHTPYPWVMVGLGAIGVVAGVAVLATAPARPANCNATTLKCQRGPDMSDADFRLTQEQAGAADSQPVLGLLVAGGGVALVAGGLLWHFLEPTGEKSGTRTTHDARRGGVSDLRVQPWSAWQSGGVSVGGRF